MSLLETLFSQGTIERLGWMLVHFLWQAIAIVLLLAMLLRLLRHATANLRYAVACGALALMVVLPLITIQLVEVPGPVAEAGPPPGISRPAAVEPLPMIVRTVDELPPLSSAPLEAADLAEPVSWQERAIAALEPALPWLVLGWLVGVFSLSAWHLGGWTQLHRLKRRLTRKIDASLHVALDELATRLGVQRTVTLLESAIVEVPTVVGCLRPMILLPASALTGLSPDQLRAILAHELAHIRRHDYLANILQTVVEILGFYHPAVWWVSNCIRVERENCCDDMAVRICGNSLQYARALTSMEEIRHSRSDLAMAATGGSLMARIARLLGRPAVDDRRFAWLPGLIALLLVIGIIIPAALVLATPTPRSEPPTPNVAALEPNVIPIDEPARTQVLLAFTIVDVFADRVLDLDTALQARDLLTLIRPADANRPITAARPPVIEDLLVPLTDVLARFEPIPLKSKDLTDLLISRGYAQVMSKPKILTFADDSGSLMVGQENDPNAPDPQSAGDYMRLTAVPHVLEDINATRLQIDYKDQRTIGSTDDAHRSTSVTQINSTLVIPNDQHVAIVAKSTRDPHTRLRLLLIGPTSIIKPQRAARQDRDTSIRTTVESLAQNKTQQQGETDILIDFMIAKVLTGAVPDHGTVSRIRGVLAAENPQIMDEPGGADPKQNVTLGEILKKPLTGRILTPATMEALMDLLQSQGYAEMQATPSVIAKNNTQAEIRITREEHFQPAEDPAQPVQHIELGTIVRAKPHLPPGASDRVLLEIGVELTDWAPQTQPGDHSGTRSSMIVSTVTTLNEHYCSLLVESDSGESPLTRDPEALLILFRPRIVRPASVPADQSAAQVQQSNKRPRQVLLDARLVVMERGNLRNVGVEWAFPTRPDGRLPEGDDWPAGLQVGYSADLAFTDALIAKLAQLEAANQAEIVSNPQIVTLDGRQAQLRSVLAEWFAMSDPQVYGEHARSKPLKIESGTIVSVTPHVGDGNEITLEVAVEFSKSLPKGRPADRAEGLPPELPIVTRRQAKNSVTVLNGGTVAIAGLTENATGQGGQSAREVAIFVTASILPEIGWTAPPASQSGQ